MSFVITSKSNPSLFSTQPSVAPNGTLSHTPADNANGTATVTVIAQDDGGILNGGDDTAPADLHHNGHIPSTTSQASQLGGDVSVNENSGAYDATWATAISAGPNESGQTVSFVVSNGNNALFSIQPAISLEVRSPSPLRPTLSVPLLLPCISMDSGGTANGGDDATCYSDLHHIGESVKRLA